MSIRERTREFLTVNPKTDPIEWIESRVSLRHDHTSAMDGLVRLEPYQIRPILAQYQSEVREVVIMGVEQTGKSACWRFPMLHKMAEYPAPRWIIYESDDKAAEINEKQFDPLLRNVPGLKGQFNRKTALKHKYNLPNGSSLDFSGAGAEITSKPMRDGVADELDTWPLTEEGIRQNLRNFRKRFRTYWARGEGCLVVVSSPNARSTRSKSDLTHSVINDEFKKTDRGYWTLRCLKCGDLTIKSYAIHHLQWECDEDTELIKPKTLTLHCPKCGHAHVEADAQKMNDKGAYTNGKGKELTDWNSKVGCQWGALCSPRVFSWLSIAEAQMAAGSTASMHAQADFSNSYKGLSYNPKLADKPGMKTLEKRCRPLPDQNDLANVFFAADTQDNGWYWVVRGIDENHNYYKLAHGFVRTIHELKKVWDSEYCGVLPVMGIIDEGGHGEMPKYVRELVLDEKGLYGYKGEGIKGKQMGLSKNVKDLILANAKRYKAELIYYMYMQEIADNHQWYLEPKGDWDEDYISQITSVQKNKNSKYGHQPENWETQPRDAPDHYFDCEKEIIVITDFAFNNLKAKQWRKPMSQLRRSVKRKKRRTPTMEM